MKVDLSPEAVTNRLIMMEQLWELSVNLMNSQEVPEKSLSGEKFHEKTEIISRKMSLRETENLSPIE